jgi:predicted CopG family antitoxin
MTKVISLSNEAYERLKKLKTKDDSFSSVVIRVTDRRKVKLSDFIGKWVGNDIDDVGGRLAAERKASHSRDMRR